MQEIFSFNFLLGSLDFSRSPCPFHYVLQSHKLSIVEDMTCLVLKIFCHEEKLLKEHLLVQVLFLSLF